MVGLSEVRKKAMFRRAIKTISTLCEEVSVDDCRETCPYAEECKVLLRSDLSPAEWAEKLEEE